MNDNRIKLRAAFNQSANFYDKIRPGYPDALIEDVIGLSGIPDRGRILEIGCGTGKATEPFVSRGYLIDCLDIGSDLAAVAAAKFKGAENVRIVVGSFEAWEPDDHGYDLVMAATSFHWLDPGLAFGKSAEIINPGGALAVFSNSHIRGKEGFFARVQDVYREYAPSMTGPENHPMYMRQNTAGEELFQEPVIRRYPWSAEYSARQYTNLLDTYSDHISLPDAVRKTLFAGIENLINVEYGGNVVKYHEALLTLRRKK